MVDREDMGSPILRFAVVTAAVSAVAVGVAAPAADANDTAVSRLNATPEWSFTLNEAPQIELASHALEVERLMEIKLGLSAQATQAEAMYDASQGKASQEALMALAVERNQIVTAVLLGESTTEVATAEAGLTEAVSKVDAEVKAWEIAEAARKAEEERKAREAAEAAAKRPSSPRATGGGGGAAPQGDPRAYLDGIAASYGTWVQWGDTACGRGSAAKVSGCYTGKDYVMVSNSAWRDWTTAKGAGRNVVLHEVSHVLIMRTCGTVFVTDRFENVTDAYAILIGAGRHTGYGYNDTDMQVARDIRNGVCPG